MSDSQAVVFGIDAETLVKRYIELRDFVQEETKAFNARMKEYTDAMEVIEGAAGLLLKQTKQRALSTDYGTAFPVAKDRYRVTDADAWHTWVREHQAWTMYTNNISKEALETWLEKTKDPDTGALNMPPGITVDSWIDIQFRRA